MRKVLYILSQLNDDDIDWLANAGRTWSVAADESLIREGMPVADLFFVLAGEASVSVSGMGELVRLGRGEIAGEMSFVDSAPPSATVTALAGSAILAVDKRAVEARLAEDTGFAARFYRALAIFLADRLRSTTSRMKSADGLASTSIVEDELDEDLLDQVSLAGIRFEHLLRTLSSARREG